MPAWGRGSGAVALLVVLVVVLVFGGEEDAGNGGGASTRADGSVARAEVVRVVDGDKPPGQRAQHQEQCGERDVPLESAQARGESHGQEPGDDLANRTAGAVHAQIRAGGKALQLVLDIAIERDRARDAER